MIALMLALACAGDAETLEETAVEADADTDADSDTDTDTDTDADTDADADADADVVLSGTVSDLNGNPLLARMQMCLESCYFAESGPDGTYTFDPLEPATYSYEIVVLQEGDWATPLVPFFLQADDAVIDLGVPLLESGSATPVGAPAEVQAASGVWLTLDEEELTLPFGADGSRTQGVRVPPDQLPPIQGVDNTVLAAFYLAPFDAHSSAGIGFRIDTQALGIADGTQLQLFASNYLTQEWLDVGTFTTAGGEVQGDSLPVLSTLLITAP